MTWDGNGNVIRTNGEFKGSNVWDRDRELGRYITAYRHDKNDNSLAAAIERCLNRNGENRMEANLDMASFEITNVGLSAETLSVASGTWTPVLRGAAGVSWTTTRAQGFYYRFGKLIFINGYIDVTSDATAPDGSDLTLEGWPFNQVADATPKVFSMLPDNDLVSDLFALAPASVWEQFSVVFDGLAANKKASMFYLDDGTAVEIPYAASQRYAFHFTGAYIIA